MYVRWRRDPNGSAEAVPGVGDGQRKDWFERNRLPDLTGHILQEGLVGQQSVTVSGTSPGLTAGGAGVRGCQGLVYTVIGAGSNRNSPSRGARVYSLIFQSWSKFGSGLLVGLTRLVGIFMNMARGNGSMRCWWSSELCGRVTRTSRYWAQKVPVL